MVFTTSSAEMPRASASSVEVKACSCGELEGDAPLRQLIRNGGHRHIPRKADDLSLVLVATGGEIRLNRAGFIGGSNL
jgi:hypothetical protein